MNSLQKAFFVSYLCSIGALAAPIDPHGILAKSDAFFSHKESFDAAFACGDWARIGLASTNLLDTDGTHEESVAIRRAVSCGADEIVFNTQDVVTPGSGTVTRQGWELAARNSVRFYFSATQNLGADTDASSGGKCEWELLSSKSTHVDVGALRHVPAFKVSALQRGGYPCDSRVRDVVFADGVPAIAQPVSIHYPGLVAHSLDKVIAFHHGPRIQRPVLPAAALRRGLISAAEEHVCAVTHGELRCWGEGKFRESQVPADVRHATQIAAGSGHNCALVGGVMRCWGHGYDPDLIDVAQLSVPSDLGPLAQITSGAWHDCALTQAGVVRCWGLSNFMRNPPTLDSPSLVSAGDSGDCAKVADGISCWGPGGMFLPERLKISAASLTDVSVGFQSACAAVDGRVLCWGYAADQILAVPQDFEGAMQVAIEANHGCATQTGPHGVKCWGEDVGGSTMPPVDLGSVIQVAVGRGFSCALTSDERVVCWGGKKPLGL